MKRRLDKNDSNSSESDTESSASSSLIAEHPTASRFSGHLQTTINEDRQISLRPLGRLSEHHHHHHHRRHAIHTSIMPKPKMKERRNILKQLGTFVKAKLKPRRKDIERGNSIDSISSLSSLASLVLHRDDIDDSEFRRKSKIRDAMQSARKVIGATDLMRELRLKREEYARKMADILIAKKSGEVTLDHPYLALRKKIEAMASKEGVTYSIDYRSFSNNTHVRDVGIPLYATGYDNERKKQARRRQFMFGLMKDDRYDFDAENIDEYADNLKHHADQTWASKRETDLALLAMVFSAANLFRFPHACYINGGIIFFFVYCVLVITLIQPLVLFELIIGQFSYKGEYGFSLLHKCAKGFCYAILFVNMTFITLQNVIAGYTGLYAIGSLLYNPALCNPEWGNRSGCISYLDVENSEAELVQARIWLENHFVSDRQTIYNAKVFLSTEMFFRFFIYNWKSKKDSFNWKFVLTFLLALICIVPSSIQSYLVSTFSRVYIHLACILPILLTLILFHQYFFRGGKSGPSYFTDFKWDRVATLVFWCDAIEMSISTIGVGFGGLIRISARNEFKFQSLRRISWMMCIFVMFFCLLSALVVFTELSILGLISRANMEYNHIIAGGFGVSFVCLSGALLKIGSVVAVVATFAWMTVFNVWSLVVTSQMGVAYVRHWLPIKDARRLKVASSAVTTSVQILLVSTYIFHADFAETDSFDLFGGCGAACVMLAAEMGIAFVLYGFREFMTDIEIMLDTPMTFAFQVQMRYYAPYAIGVAYFIIAVSWFFNPPRYKNYEDQKQSVSQSTFWIGFVLNAIPILILAMFGYWGFHESTKKRLSINENSKMIEKKKGVKMFWKTKARWIGRRAAVTGNLASIPKYSLFVISKTGNLATKLAQYEMKLVHSAHVELRDRLRKLYSFLRARVKWIIIMDKILSKLPLKSIANATKCVLRHNDLQTTMQELSILKRMIEQCSVINLAKCTQNKIQGKEFSDQEVILFDHLIDNTSLYSDDSEEESLDEIDEDIDTVSYFSMAESEGALDDVIHSTSTIESGNTSVYRKVVGKPKKSDEEIMLDISVRIRRRLELPYENLLNQLRRLRDQRFRKEREIIQRFDGTPSEYFITVKIARNNEKSFLVGFRVIVLPHGDHFVIKRLPHPRPPIVYTTQNQLNRSYQGINRNEQLFKLAIFTMKQRLWRTELSTLLRPSNRTSLLDNINDEIYRFIEPDKTCIIVLEDEVSASRKHKWRWITPTLKRNFNKPPSESQDEFYTFDYEEVTIAELLGREKEQQRREAILNQPSDILYHPSGEEFVVQNSQLKVIRPPPSAVHIKSSTSSVVSRHNILNESVISQLFGRPTTAITSHNDETAPHVTHLTELNWKRRKTEFQTPVIVIHESRQPFKKSTTDIATTLSPKTFDLMRRNAISMAIRENSASVQGHATDKGAPNHPLFLLAELAEQHSSANSFRISFDESKQSAAASDFSNLKNDFPNFYYYTNGKTLVVLKRFKAEVQGVASGGLSLRSIVVAASVRVPPATIETPEVVIGRGTTSTRMTSSSTSVNKVLKKKVSKSQQINRKK